MFYQPKLSVSTEQTAGVDLPPVLSGRTSDEIFATMAAFAGSADRAALGARGRAWVLAHHSYDAVRPQYEQFYRDAVSDHAH